MTMKQLYKVPFENNSESVKDLRYQYVQVNYWCALSEFFCNSKMPVLLEVLETHKKRKYLLNSIMQINFILFLCFFVENHGVRRTWNNPHSCFCRRGRVQSVQRPETWSQSHWTPSNNWHSRPTLQCVPPFQRILWAHIFHTYNTQLLLAFLNTLYRDLIPEQERGLVRPYLPNYVVIWDNVSFHRTNIVRDWFAAHERVAVQFLPPYSHS